jgi:hypothetical protein
MPLLTLNGKLYSIPRTELDKYEVSPDEASKQGFTVSDDTDGDEVGEDELEGVSGGTGVSAKRMRGDSEPKRDRIGRPGAISPQPQWYSGD